MADIRVAPGVRIVDLDSGNEADVSAAGNLHVAVNLALPAGSNNIGIVDTELPAAAALADNTANPTVPAVGSFVMGFDGTNWDRIRADGGSIFIQDGGNSITVDGSVSISGAVDTELPAAAALADGAANPTTPMVGANLLGWNGTTWDRVYTVADGAAVAAGTKGFLALGTDGTNYQVLATNASGHISINDGGNSITVDGTVTTTSAAPTSPVSSVQTSAAVAAGASATLDTADIPTKVGYGVDLTASVPFKAVVSIVANGVATTVTTLFGRAGEAVRWVPPHKAFFTVAGATAGQDGLRAVVTNLDASEAADVYATFYYAND